jgi:general secretion pathway protein F
MLGVLLPRMQSFLSEADVTLPALTECMLAVGRWAKVWGALLLAALVGAVFAFRLRLQSDSGLRERCDRRLLALPGIGRGYGILVNMRFTRTLCLLLEGGVPLIEGFVLAGRATGSVAVSSQVAHEAERVRHGQRLSEAVARIHPLSGALPGWVRVGEASGGMAHLMATAAKRYEAQWDRFMSRSLGVLEPALIVLIGGFVLLVTLAVLLPVLDMTQSVHP